MVLSVPLVSLEYSGFNSKDRTWPLIIGHRDRIPTGRGFYSVCSKRLWISLPEILLRFVSMLSRACARVLHHVAAALWTGMLQDRSWEVRATQAIESYWLPSLWVFLYVLMCVADNEGVERRFASVDFQAEQSQGPKGPKSPANITYSTCKIRIH